MEIATVAGGCFWCTEAIFKRLQGVIKVTPGYSGGSVDHPSYEQVSSGTTGHAEAVQIEFDPSQLGYKTLLDVFFHVHDPTTHNRQGNDVGPQYRSVIFYHTPEQKIVAEDVKKTVSRAVTEIRPFTNFYPAEDYHRDYFEKNSYQPYCQYVIDPKITKLLVGYRDLVKEAYRA